MSEFPYDQSTQAQNMVEPSSDGSSSNNYNNINSNDSTNSDNVSGKYGNIIDPTVPLNTVDYLQQAKAQKQERLQQKVNNLGNLEGTSTQMPDGTLESNSNKIWNNMSDQEYQTMIGDVIGKYGIPKEKWKDIPADQRDNYQWLYMGHGKDDPNLFKIGLASALAPGAEYRYEPGRAAAEGYTKNEKYGWASGPHGIDDSNMDVQILLPKDVATAVEALTHGRTNALANRASAQGNSYFKQQYGDGYTEYYSSPQGALGDTSNADLSNVTLQDIRNTWKDYLQIADSKNINPDLYKTIIQDQAKQYVQQRAAQNMGMLDRAYNTAAAVASSFTKEAIVDTADWIGETSKRLTGYGWDVGTDKQKSEMADNLFGYNPYLSQQASKVAGEYAKNIYEGAMDSGKTVQASDVWGLIKTGLETPEMLGESLGYLGGLLLGGGKFTAVGKIAMDADKAVKLGNLTVQAAKAQVDAAKAIETSSQLVRRVGAENAGFLTVVAGNVNDEIDTFKENNDGKSPDAYHVVGMLANEGVMNAIDRFTDVSILKAPDALKKLKDAAKFVPDQKAAQIAAKILVGAAKTTVSAGAEAGQEYIQQMGQAFNEQFGSSKYGNDALEILTSKQNVIDALSAAGMGASMGAEMHLAGHALPTVADALVSASKKVANKAASKMNSYTGNQNNPGTLSIGTSTFNGSPEQQQADSEDLSNLHAATTTSEVPSFSMSAIDRLENASNYVATLGDSPKAQEEKAKIEAVRARIEALLAEKSGDDLKVSNLDDTGANPILGSTDPNPETNKADAQRILYTLVSNATSNDPKVKAKYQEFAEVNGIPAREFNKIYKNFQEVKHQSTISNTGYEFYHQKLTAQLNSSNPNPRAISHGFEVVQRWRATNNNSLQQLKDGIKQAEAKANDLNRIENTAHGKTANLKTTHRIVTSYVKQDNHFADIVIKKNDSGKWEADTQTLQNWVIEKEATAQSLNRLIHRYNTEASDYISEKAPIEETYDPIKDVPEVSEQVEEDDQGDKFRVKAINGAVIKYRVVKKEDNSLKSLAATKSASGIISLKEGITKEEVINYLAHDITEDNKTARKTSTQRLKDEYGIDLADVFKEMNEQEIRQFLLLHEKRHEMQIAENAKNNPNVPFIDVYNKDKEHFEYDADVFALHVLGLIPSKEENDFINSTLASKNISIKNGPKIINDLANYELALTQNISDEKRKQITTKYENTLKSIENSSDNTLITAISDAVSEVASAKVNIAKEKISKGVQPYPYNFKLNNLMHIAVQNKVDTENELLKTANMLLDLHLNVKAGEEDIANNIDSPYAQNHQNNLDEYNKLLDSVPKDKADGFNRYIEKSVENLKAAVIEGKDIPSNLSDVVAKLLGKELDERNAKDEIIYSILNSWKEISSSDKSTAEKNAEINNLLGEDHQEELTTPILKDSLANNLPNGSIAYEVVNPDGTVTLFYGNNAEERANNKASSNKGVVRKVNLDPKSFISTKGNITLLSRFKASELPTVIKNAVKKATAAIKKIIPSTEMLEDKVDYYQKARALLNSPARSLLFNDKGEFNEQTIAAMYFSLMDLLNTDITKLTTGYKTREQVAAMFGIYESEVTPEMLDLLNSHGALVKTISTTLGKNVLSQLNLGKGYKASNDPAAKDSYEVLVADIGHMAMLMGVELGYLEITEEKSNTLAAFYRNGVKLAPKTTTRFVNVVTHNVAVLDAEGNKTGFSRKELTPSVKKAREDFKEFSDKVPGVATAKVWPTKQRISEQEITETQNVVRNDDSGIGVVPEAAKETLKHLMTTEYVIDAAGAKEIIDLYDNEDTRSALLANLGYIEIDENNPKYVSLVKYDKDIQASINRDIIKSIEALKEGAEKFHGDSFYFKFSYVRNGRYLLDSNTINPQTDKLHRFLIQPLAHLLNYKVEGGNGLPMRFTVDGVDTSYYVRVALAQAMGVGIDKTDTKKLVALGDVLLSMNPDQLVDLKKKLIHEGEAVLAVTMGDNTIETFKVEAEHLSHTLQALRFLSDIHNSTEKNGVKNISSSLSAEFDSLTSGFANKMNQMPILGDKDRIDTYLARVGVLNSTYQENIPDNEIEGMNSLLGNPDFLDSYKNLGKGVIESLDIYEENVDPELLIALKDILPGGQYIEGSRRNIVVDKAMRNLFKYPFMVFNYSGGISTITKNIAFSITMDVFRKIAKMEPTDDFVVKFTRNPVLQNTKYFNNPKELIEFARNDPRMATNPLFMQIQESVLGSYGEATRKIFEKEFARFIKIQDATNDLFRISYSLFNTALQKKLEVIRKANNVVTEKDVLESIKELADIFPHIAGPLTGETNAIIPVHDVDVTSKSANRDSAQTQVINNGKVVGKVINPIIKQIAEAVSAGSVLPFHFIDGAELGQTINEFYGELGDKGGITPIHDAIIPALNQADLAIWMYNKSVYEINANYDLLSALLDSADKWESTVRSLGVDEAWEHSPLKENNKDKPENFGTLNSLGLKNSKTDYKGKGARHLSLKDTSALIIQRLKEYKDKADAFKAMMNANNDYLYNNMIGTLGGGFTIGSKGPDMSYLPKVSSLYKSYPTETINVLTKEASDNKLVQAEELSFDQQVSNVLSTFSTNNGARLLLTKEIKKLLGMEGSSAQLVTVFVKASDTNNLKLKDLIKALEKRIDASKMKDKEHAKEHLAKLHALIAGTKNVENVKKESGTIPTTNVAEQSSSNSTAADIANLANDITNDTSNCG